MRDLTGSGEETGVVTIRRKVWVEVLVEEIFVGVVGRWDHDRVDEIVGQSPRNPRTWVPGSRGGLNTSPS